MKEKPGDELEPAYDRPLELELGSDQRELVYSRAGVRVILALFVVPRNRKPGEATACLMLIFLLQAIRGWGSTVT